MFNFWIPQKASNQTAYTCETVYKFNFLRITFNYNGVFNILTCTSFICSRTELKVKHYHPSRDHVREFSIVKLTMSQTI